MNKTKNFTFKQFTIDGGLSGMPVSTDGVLLGAWANITHSQSILDIGAGTGLLSLMCAQRSPNSTITAVEIDAGAYQAAQENFICSPWSKRLRIVRENILTWSAQKPFDSIICNPPYFNSGEQSKIKQRAIARHADSLPHKDLLKVCKQQLSPNGRANFILPELEGSQFIVLAKSAGWHLSRLCEISTTENKPVNRLLFELSINETNTERSELVIHQSGQYSLDFIALTKEFYLKM